MKILDEKLCKIIDERTEPWGTLYSFEIRNVIIHLSSHGHVQGSTGRTGADVRGFC